MKKKSSLFSLHSFFTLVCLNLALMFLLPTALAENTPLTFPAPVGVSITGLTGNNTMGFADALAPLVGQPLDFFFIDPQAQYLSSDHYSAALGIGKRALTRSAGILDAYVFADYDSSLHGNGFWFISPGVERLGNVIDLSANLYVPVGQQRENGGLVFASDIGDYNHVKFEGHNAYDQQFLLHESVGIGGDAEIGYRLPVKNNSKIYIGGYYFNPQKAKDVTGGAARLEIPLSSHFNLLLSEGYDNIEHNTLKAGISWNFGGRHTDYNYNQELSSRMLAPIHRNLAVTTGSATTAQPVVESKKLLPDELITASNISFFTPNGSPNGDCTYENTCALNQDNINNANQSGNNTLYIDEGTYGSTTQGLPTLTIYNNQNLYGRADQDENLFVKPAEGAERPLIYFANNGFDLMGNAVISSLQLYAQPTAPTATANTALININSGKVNIDNVLMQGNGSYNADGINIENSGNSAVNVTINDATIQNFHDGILLNNSGTGQLTAEIDNSTISHNLNNGIDAINTGSTQTANLNLTVNHSTVEMNVSDGIYLENNSAAALNAKINATHIDYNNNGINAMTDYSANATGLLNVIVTHSMIENNWVNGILLQNFNNANGAGSQLTVTDSTIRDNKNGSGISVGNNSAENVLVKINGSTIMDNATGISLQNSGQGTLTASIDKTKIKSNKFDGIAVSNQNNSQSGVSALTLTIDHSQILNNGNDGLGINNQGQFNGDNTNANTTVTIKNSKINGNFGSGTSLRNSNGDLTFTAQNSQISGNANGIRATNYTGNMNLTLDKDTINKNKQDGLNMQNNSDGLLNATITNSTLNKNIQGIEAFNSSYTANSPGIMNLVINHTVISNNLHDGIFMENLGPGELNASLNKVTVKNNGQNGIEAMMVSFFNAQPEGDLNLDVTNSDITHNKNDGIFINNFSTGQLNANFNNDTIDQNTNGIEADSQGWEGSQTQVNIQNSSVENNVMTAIAGSGSQNVINIDNTTITGSTIAIDANNGTEIDVTRPGDFDGMVINSGGVITFPGINNVPNGIVHIVCQNNICHAES